MKKRLQRHAETPVFSTDSHDGQVTRAMRSQAMQCRCKCGLDRWKTIEKAHISFKALVADSTQFFTLDWILLLPWPLCDTLPQLLGTRASIMCTLNTKYSQMFCDVYTPTQDMQYIRAHGLERNTKKSRLISM